MQQEMQNQPQPRSSFAYEGEQTQNPSAYHLYGQKLSMPVSGMVPTPGQRLALAIVSLSLLILLIFGLAILAATLQAPGWIVGTIVFVFILFSAVATIINLAFKS